MQAAPVVVIIKCCKVLCDSIAAANAGTKAHSSPCKQYVLEKVDSMQNGAKQNKVEGRWCMEWGKERQPQEQGLGG